MTMTIENTMQSQFSDIKSKSVGGFFNKTSQLRSRVRILILIFANPKEYKT